MVLCVLQNQQMEIGNAQVVGNVTNSVTNRKRKRKLDVPARRFTIVHESDNRPGSPESPENSPIRSTSDPENSPMKIIKLNPDDEELEHARIPQSYGMTSSPPIQDTINKLEPEDICPKQEVDPEIITKVEIVEVGTVKSNSEDEEDRAFDGLPEILRNQAKSRRARAKAAAERLRGPSPGQFGRDNSSCGSSNRSSSPPSGHSMNKSSSSPSSGYQQKKSSAQDDNKYYKNMSRERRLIANARERTRVHTISTAFDALRQAIPTYSYNQKLSKLAILRIASAYIKSLSAMTEEPEALEDLMVATNQPDTEAQTTKPNTKTNFSQCVADCTKTLQMECRARSRRKGRKD